MPKRVRTLLVVLALLALGGGIWFYQFQVRPQRVDTLTLYGNVDIREVQPAFNSSGQITAMHVQEGAVVKQGELLATLDDTRYAAALAQAKATMDAARVTCKNDEANYRRLDALVTTNAASIKQRDDAKAKFEASHANCEAAAAAVALAQREFDDTRL